LQAQRHILSSISLISLVASHFVDELLNYNGQSFGFKLELLDIICVFCVFSRRKSKSFSALASSRNI